MAKMMVFFSEGATHAAVSQDNEMECEAMMEGGRHDGSAAQRTPPPIAQGTLVLSHSCMLHPLCTLAWKCTKQSGAYAKHN